MFGRAAKKENEQLHQKIEELEAMIASLGGGEVIKLQEAKKERQRELEELQEKKNAELESLKASRAMVEQDVSRLRARAVELEKERAKLDDELVNSREEVRLQSFGLYDFSNPAEDSLRLEKQLAEVRLRIKELIKNKQAVTAAQGFTYNNSTAKGKTFVNKLSKLALRSYNAEVENAVTRLKAGNLAAGQKRLEKARTEVARMGDMINLEITRAFHQLRLRELELASQHLEAKKALKEQEAEERARLREEKKAQAEMEAERKRLEKEQAHYLNALEKIEKTGTSEEAEELKAKLVEIQKGIEDVDYRAANIRAGYVYVISNIGSFGEKMVKIGLTRRLDPMDRVKELGDASVPFNFDVHALHFSADAVGVENALHRHFEAVRVNRINNRREFFYTTPAEVKKVLSSIDGNVLEYRDEAEAEQFRLSEAMRATGNTEL